MLTVLDHLHHDPIPGISWMEIKASVMAGDNDLWNVSEASMSLMGSSSQTSIAKGALKSTKKNKTKHFSVYCHYSLVSLHLVPRRHTMWTSRCRTVLAQPRLTYVGWRQIMAPSVSPLPRRGETAPLPRNKRWRRFWNGPKQQVQSLSSVISRYDAPQLWVNDAMISMSSVVLFLLCFHVILCVTITRTDFIVRTSKVFWFELWLFLFLYDLILLFNCSVNCLWVFWEAFNTDITTGLQQDACIFFSSFCLF